MSTPAPIGFTFPEEVLQQIAYRVAEILAEGPGATMPQRGHRWLTIDQAADYIGATRKRIYDLRSSGRLSRTGDGSRVLVDRQELDDLIGRVR